MTPLAERMRPKSISEYLAQNHLMAKDAPLYKVIEAGTLPSLILWGPPGTGKTTLAHLIATKLNRKFYNLSALNTGVKDIRELIEDAKRQDLFYTQSPIVFIDEVHRFNKSQQDSLLQAVEKGWISFIGATTENPSFEIIPALLSRCQVYTLKAFAKNELEQLLQNAIEKDKILSQYDIQLIETEALIRFSGGDARKLLNALELVILNEKNNTKTISITNAIVLDHIQQHISLYDKNGDMHYDIVSAFIKSIRGSDPQATVYWLARMIEGGEEVKFIARRMLIAAAEDIGLANPTALVIANSCFQAVTTIGYPEARIILSQCAIYLATSPKSNSAYLAINQAQELVKKTGDLPVPLHLRNAPTKLMKDLHYGDNYKYSHDYPEHFVYQEFMPDGLSNTNLYNPAQNTKEQQIALKQQSFWHTKYKNIDPK